MARTSVTIVNWNVEWRRPTSNAADILRQRISACDPDIVCLTEAYCDMLTGGFVIEAEADYGYPITAGRRKVLLWSKQPWTNVDVVGHSNLPTGRFIRGNTETSLGQINVTGICIPWSGAHVSTGRRDRKRWGDHMTYLEGLETIIPKDPTRTIVLGDFNQKVPRSIAPMEAFEQLQRAVLDRLNLATEGVVEPLEVTLIDHVAHSSDLKAQSVKALSNEREGGARLSDHVGVSVSFTG